ncbi:MAG TPA: SIS domain-containing protein [Cyclobacteriaceae bacterium]
MEDFVKKYIDGQVYALKSIPASKVANLVSLFREALENDRQIFVCGNGGSAANASHFVTDLGKGSSDKTYRRFRCLSLNDNVSWMTALGNDYDYSEIFSRQLMNLAKPGDILMVMSVSGSSHNLVRTVDWAKSSGCVSIALVGGKKGRLAEIADHVVVVDDEHYGRVEDAHMGICHMIAYAFMEIEKLQKPK